MKQLLLFFAITAIATQTFATIRTVSNNPSTIAQFNNIQDAINAASAGDTIYVHGSPNNYAGFNVDRQLIIIGPGYSPTKNLPHIAQITTTINFNNAAASGTEIHGLTIATNMSIAVIGVNNLKFIRNRLFQSSMSLAPSTGGTITGYLFESNWFENYAMNTNTTYTLQNFILTNNLFYDNGCCIAGHFSGWTNTVNILIDHNLFYGPSGGSRDVFSSNTRFMLITNNIFVRRNAAANLSSSTFNNNITFNAGNDAPWSVNSNVDGGGNVAGQSPQMADQTAVDNGTNSAFLDFTIAAGPANNSGSDGKDMGLLFDGTGSLNWVNGRTSRIPYIFSMNITTPTVAPGGNVSVTVESRRSN